MDSQPGKEIKEAASNDSKAGAGDGKRASKRRRVATGAKRRPSGEQQTESAVEEAVAMSRPLSEVQLREAMVDLQGSAEIRRLADVTAEWACELLDRPARSMPAVWVNLHALLCAAPSLLPVSAPTGAPVTPSSPCCREAMDPFKGHDEDTDDRQLAMMAAASGTASLAFRPALRASLAALAHGRAADLEEREDTDFEDEDDDDEGMQSTRARTSRASLPASSRRLLAYTTLCGDYSMAVLAGERPLFGLQQTPNTCRRLVACSRCKDWFVAASLGLSAAATAALGSDWLCPCCVAYAQRGALRRSAHLWRLGLLWQGHLQNEKAQ